MDAIRPNPLNPRAAIDQGEEMAELVASIRARGLLQPIAVTPAGLIIQGHRRHAACRQAGLTHVPVMVRDVGEVEQLEEMLIENIHRKGLTAVEMARGCQGLRERGRTLEQVAVQTGLSSETVRKHLLLLTLPEALQRRCADGELPLGWVPHLVRLSTPAEQMKVARDGVRLGWTCEQLGRVIDKILGPPSRKYPVADIATRPTQTTTRVLGLCAELVTEFQRQPDLVVDAVVQDWIKRLAHAIRAAEGK